MTESLTARRARLLGPGVPTFYAAPVHLVAGEGVWVRDAGGRRYLDAYNNVPHVGHGHPRVVEAVARQLATLNTHSRYLHDAILDHAERLTARLGHGLGQVLYVCTGSEANDVALRMAQAATGRMGLIATDAGYHGNTALVSAVTASRTPIGGRPAFVRLVPAPDRAGAATPAGFAAGVQEAIAALAAGGHGLAAMILCPFQANEGFPDLPAGFFAPAAAAVRAAGGLLVADEVQPGFGRLGSHLWAHDRAGLVPDILTLGKPMGNGYPVAAVVAGPGPMAAFRDRFRYFNTFGASPVAAAAALATLEVLEEEGLQARAATTGERLRAALAAAVPPALASVRGTGLFLGLAFRLPALAREVVEGLRAEGVLAGLAGRDDEVLKLRPPMPFGDEHAGILLAALGRVLARLDSRA
ncbi:MAG: aminotransferase class III-fold pyridoxal phosphate-dependent enzyme [Rhodobacteraceae bacterium]|nr:aminotransferase class III-fold pyridoxal phosphate-dependent enzyme [Paracoccaceae bacterium]